MTNNDKVIARIKAAVNAGVKITALVNGDISHFRIASAVKPSTYRTTAKFTDREIADLNCVLDSIAATILQGQ